MLEEDVSTIEKIATNSLDYVLSFKPRAVGAESAQHFSKMNVIRPVALNVYPQIYTDLITRFDRDEATRRLKNMGRNVAKLYYCAFPEMLRKPQKFKDIFLGIAKSQYQEKLEFKEVVTENNTVKSCILQNKDCYFCTGFIEDIDTEKIGIPYCAGKAGAYENLYNIKSLYHKNLVPRLIRVDGIKSAQFEGDVCEYRLVAID